MATFEVLQDRQLSTIIAFAIILPHGPVTHHHCYRIELVIVGLFMPLYVIYCTDLEPDLAVNQTFGLIERTVLIARQLAHLNHPHRDTAGLRRLHLHRCRHWLLEFQYPASPAIM